MLVLSRKLGEKIVIGDNIVVTVVKIDRNQIRLGIEAPHDVPVYREEIAPASRPPIGSARRSSPAEARDGQRARSVGSRPRVGPDARQGRRGPADDRSRASLVDVPTAAIRRRSARRRPGPS